MKKLIAIILSAAALVLTVGCAADKNDSSEEDIKGIYVEISQEDAKQMMDNDDSNIIIDVRRQDEYDEGHIPGAVCIPNESIMTEQPEELPDKDQVILVYCRSGRRSKQAAQKLADMGYTNVYEFGGIIDWTGDIVKE
ncbi:MAG: rhodanese-like domain-containing protein [Ruminococcus sp.]|nr:rhodanese-like domain-containing protein [Ruminococcus sp.]